MMFAWILFPLKHRSKLLHFIQLFIIPCKCIIHGISFCVRLLKNYVFARAYHTSLNVRRNFLSARCNLILRDVLRLWKKFKESMLLFFRGRIVVSNLFTITRSLELPHKITLKVCAVHKNIKHIILIEYFLIGRILCNHYYLSSTWLYIFANIF